MAKSSQIATIDRPYKFKNKSTKLSIMRNVNDFSEKIFVLCSHWRKPRRMHPTFMRGILIVWAIEIQVARDPELNPGNYITIFERIGGQLWTDHSHIRIRRRKSSQQARLTIQNPPDQQNFDSAAACNHGAHSTRIRRVQFSMRYFRDYWEMDRTAGADGQKKVWKKKPALRPVYPPESPWNEAM